MGPNGQPEEGRGEGSTRLGWLGCGENARPRRGPCERGRERPRELGFSWFQGKAFFFFLFYSFLRIVFKSFCRQNKTHKRINK
jgi:hypothetical protein